MVNCVKNFKLFVSDLNFMDETGWNIIESFESMWISL